MGRFRTGRRFRAAQPGRSFALYITTWASGGDEAITALKASAQHIQRAAAEILSRFDPATAIESRQTA